MQCRYDRCREIIGVTPDTWQEYLTGATNLEPSGKIAKHFLRRYH